MPHPIIVNYFVIEIKSRGFKNVTKHMNKNEEEKASDGKKKKNNSATHLLKHSKYSNF